MSNIVNVTEFDPLKQFITYESETKIVFEFPRDTVIDYLNAVPKFMNYFKDVTVETYFDSMFMVPKKITCIKRLELRMKLISDNKLLS
jgi:hypothetical protein